MRTTPRLSLTRPFHAIQRYIPVALGGQVGYPEGMDVFIASLSQVLIFAVQAALIVLAILAVLGIVFGSIREGREAAKSGYFRVEDLNRIYRERREMLEDAMVAEGAGKGQLKQRKREAKERLKQEKRGQEAEARPRLFVLDFDGDISASNVAALRHEVSAIVSVADPKRDEVLLVLESPGGTVPGYGLAAAQLMRLKKAGIRLVVAVDQVAASGGYMMACCADHLVAAPFALLGSIGVVGQVPNFRRLLTEKGIDVEMETAGQYKRTLTLFGNNTDAARQKFRDDLQNIHDLFKDFVGTNRPKTDINVVATGEAWSGTQALGLGLIDALGTSDDLITDQLESMDALRIRFMPPRKMSEKARHALGRILGKASQTLASQFTLGQTQASSSPSLSSSQKA